MSDSAETSYHRQNRENGCGAAVAMMMLSDEQVGIRIADLSQGILLSRAHKNPLIQGWATHPQGLNFVLNERRPNGFSIKHQERYLDSLGVIAAAIDQTKVAPAVLLGGTEHWVVVNQLVTQVMQGKETLIHALIHNPWTSNRNPPDPHAEGDSCRPTGNADKRIPAKKWKRIFLECRCFPEHPQASEFLEVVANFSGSTPELESFEPPPLPEPPLDVPAEHIDPDWVQDNFFDLVRRFKMEEILPPAVTPDTPRLVEMRNDRRRDYYLVSLRRGDRVVGVASFEAKSGDLESVQEVDPEAREDEIVGKPKLRDAGSAGVLDFLAEEVEKLEDILRIRSSSLDLERDVTIPEIPLWTPCTESRSEYLPFWKVTIQQKDIYIRLDGEIFLELTRGALGA